MSSWWRRWTYPIRLLNPRNRRHAEADLDAEVAAHLEAEIQERLEGGLPSEQAHHAARRAFGNVGLFKEQAREAWGVGPLDRFWQDLRYGARMIAKKRVVSVVAVLSLGLGIGANTAFFTILKAALYAAPPLYQQPDRLVNIWETAPREPGGREWVSSASYLAWTEEKTLFESLAAAQPGVGVSLQLEDYPVQAWAQRVSADLLPTLGVEPQLGRNFLAAEEEGGSAPSVILGQGLWQGRFGGDPGIVGMSLSIDRRAHHVIGVMPRGFWFADGYTELWLPLRVEGVPPSLEDRRLKVVGRLAEQVGLDEAHARLASLVPHLEQEYASGDRGWGVRLERVRTIDAMGGEVPPGFVKIFGALGLVLLIACANIANVMVARGSARQQETAVRSALGAGRFRLIRQLLTESLLLAGLGGVVGLLFTYWGIALIVYFAPGDLSRSMDLQVDGVAFAVPFLVALLTGLLSGLAPAVADSRVDVNGMLKAGGDGRTTGAPRQRVRSLVVIAEVALTLMLLVGIGLLVKSFAVLKNLDPGFDQERLMTFLVELPEAEYVNEAAEADGRAGGEGLVEINPRALLLFDALTERLEGLPEVESVAFASQLPPGSGGRRGFTSGDVAIAEHGGAAPTVACNPVSPGYFDVLRGRMLRGRALSHRDTRGAPWVAVINEALARRYWPDEDPIGQAVTLVPAVGERPRTIVGVVADLRNQGMSLESVPEMYVSYLQQPSRIAPERGRSRLEALFLLRASAPSQSLGAVVRAAVAEVDPGLAISDVTTLRARLDVAAQEILLGTFLIGPIIALALALSCVGIHGILSFSVSRRTRELGVRIALGAQRSGLLKLVLGQALKLVGVGVALGILGAVALRGLLSGLLRDLVSVDPLLLAGCALLLAVVAITASYIPARRATKVDPVTALRYE